MTEWVYYNLTNLTNAGNQTNVLTFVSGVNDLMNGVPTLLMLVAVGIVLFLILTQKGYNPYQSIASATFVLLILSMMLYL